MSISLKVTHDHGASMADIYVNLMVMQFVLGDAVTSHLSTHFCSQDFWSDK